jgi:transposase
MRVLIQEQRRERRKRVAADIDLGIPIPEVCKKYAITYVTARKAMEEFMGPRQKRRRAKRKRLLSLLRQGIPLRQAAQRAGLRHKAALAWCQLAKVLPVHPKPFRRQAHWERLDWSKRDADLAREEGLSRERIRQIRAKLGRMPSLPFSVVCAARQSVRDFTTWAESHRDEIATQTIRQLATRFNLKLNIVRHHLLRLGLEFRSGYSDR